MATASTDRHLNSAALRARVHLTLPRTNTEVTRQLIFVSAQILLCYMQTKAISNLAGREAQGVDWHRVFVRLNLLNDEHLPVVIDGLVDVTVFYRMGNMLGVKRPERVTKTAFWKLQPIQIPTCADEDDGMRLSVQSQHAVHDNAGQQRAPSHQQRPPAQRPDGLVHQRTVPDELEGLVRQVQRSVHPHLPCQIINALKQEVALSNGNCLVGNPPFYYIKVLEKDTEGFTKTKINPPVWLCCRLTAPGLGTGISPVYITHFM